MIYLVILAIIIGLVVIALLINHQFPGVISETLENVKIRLTPKPPIPRAERIARLKQMALDSDNRVKDLEAAIKKRKAEQEEELQLKRQIIATQNKEKMLRMRRR